MVWFRKEKKPKEIIDSLEKKVQMPKGLWLRCDDCREIMYRKEVERNFKVCIKCGYHFPMSAKERLENLFDDEKYQELDALIEPEDPLKFKDSKRYKERLKAMQARTGLKDALVTGLGYIGGYLSIICSFEFEFIGGSMGSVVGEKVTRGIEYCIEKKAAFITVTCTGGARMQEGILSLMQMAKTSAALTHLSDAKLPYISVLANPTTGGVTASFAMLGDVIIAEPKALIGFAGPRVIRETIRQELPEGFQKSEFLLQHGMVDMVVPRPQLKEKIINIISFFMPLEGWSKFSKKENMNTKDAD